MTEYSTKVMILLNDYNFLPEEDDIQKFLLLQKETNQKKKKKKQKKEKKMKNKEEKTKTKKKKNLANVERRSTAHGFPSLEHSAAHSKGEWIAPSTSRSRDEEAVATESLEKLSYKDLQKKCKALGIKANGKKNVRTDKCTSY